MTLPQVADSLAGRMEIADLLPLSQSELRGVPGDFLERVFRGKAPAVGEPATGPELTQCVLSGGYPEGLGRATWPRRKQWFMDYTKSIIERDVRDISQIEHIRRMPRLLRVLAQHASELVNYSGIGAPLGMNHLTTQKYTNIFEQLFLIRTLQPWYTNELKRLIKTPKLHFLDSGLLTALRNLSPAQLQASRTVRSAARIVRAGRALETRQLERRALRVLSFSGPIRQRGRHRHRRFGRPSGRHRSQGCGHCQGE